MPVLQKELKIAYLGMLAFGPDCEFYKGYQCHSTWLKLDRLAWHRELVDVTINKSDK